MPDDQGRHGDGKVWAWIRKICSIKPLMILAFSFRISKFTRQNCLFMILSSNLRDNSFEFFLRVNGSKIKIKKLEGLVTFFYSLSV